jgi:hypothetical protein
VLLAEGEIPPDLAAALSVAMSACTVPADGDDAAATIEDFDEAPQPAAAPLPAAE